MAQQLASTYYTVSSNIACLSYKSLGTISNCLLVSATLKSNPAAVLPYVKDEKY